MKKAAPAVLCVALCLLLVSGCGIVSRVISAARGALHHSAEPSYTSSAPETMEASGTPRLLPTVAAETPQPTKSAAVSKTLKPTQTLKATATPKPAQSAKPIKTTQPVKTVKPTKTPKPSATAAPLSGNHNNITQKELLEFFRQVVFGSDENAIAVKWADQVVVSVSGSHNQQTGDYLTGLLDQVNEYEGFPGFVYAEAAGAGAKANLQVKFVTAKQLAAAVPGWSGKTPCYAEYWYNDNYEVYKGDIYIVSAMETKQEYFYYDLSWGVFYTMGLLCDSPMYYDSVFNTDYYNEAYHNQFKYPTVADWYLVSMLYSKPVKPGMTYQQAAAALSDYFR